MEQETCETPGHEDKPAQYTVDEKRVRDRLYKYKLSPEKFQEMLEAQESRCKSCKDVLVLEKKYPFAIDHDHACCPGEWGPAASVSGAFCATTATRV